MTNGLTDLTQSSDSVDYAETQEWHYNWPGVPSEYFITTLASNHALLNPCAIDVSLSMPYIQRTWCQTDTSTVTATSHSTTHTCPANTSYDGYQLAVIAVNDVATGAPVLPMADYVQVSNLQDLTSSITGTVGLD